MRELTIDNGIRLLDLSVYLEESHTLIIADTHIGFEEYLNKTGVMVPRFQLKELKKRLLEILESVDAEQVVINGDLKHEFGTISRQEWRDTLDFLDFLMGRVGRVVLVKGNHDTILGPIARKRGLEIVNEWKADNVLVMHGDKEAKNLKGVKTIIIGHEHPAIMLREKNRRELFKCFLKGTYRGRTLIVMPSFNLVTEGTNIQSSRLLSPLIRNIDEFEVYAVADGIYPLGRLSDIK